MQLASRIRHARSKVLVLGVAVIALALVIALGTANNGSTGVASTFEDVPIDQTIQRGSVSVTLEQLRLGEHETQLQYKYNAPGKQVEPLGIPNIELPGGDQLRGNGGGFDGEMPITRTFTFPALPEDADTITVDVGSFIEHAPATVSVEIPLGDASEADPDEAGRRELPLDVEFSIGDAEYRVTRLLLGPDDFVLVCKPANDSAARMVLGGQSAGVSLTDNKDGRYDGFLSGAEWSPASSGGHMMSYQGFHFDGLPNPNATLLTLNLDGVSHIRAPFVFQVDIRQEEEGQ